MPAYITPVGVQQVTVTISAGSTSGTATISAVGSLAFILFGGSSSSDPQPNNASVFLTLTNSTTLTATRTGTSGSCIVACSVVDATSNLVTSVQYGTVTLVSTNTSNTAVISAVNANTSALEFMGFSTNNTVTVPSTQLPGLTYSGTTVTATVTTAVTSTMVVSFCMIEFNSSALNSNVQIFSTSWLNSATTTTQAITSVAVNNTILIHGGHRSTNLTTFATSKQRSTLTNSTTVTITVNTGGSDTTNVYNFTIIEFASGVLMSPVQRGNISIGGLSATATISSVNVSKTGCYSNGTSTDVGTAHNRTNVKVVLTNSTTVTASRDSAAGSANISYLVAEFSSGSGSTLLLMGVG